MLKRSMGLMFLGCVVVVWGVGPAAVGDVQISVTISGSIDEMLPILMQLREMGAGAVFESEESLKVRVHSVTVGPAGEEPEPQPGEEPVEQEPEIYPPQPALAAPAVVPGAAKAGQEVVVTVAVRDSERIIDTLGMEVNFPEPLVSDLFDKGEEGDVVAGDNVWTRKIVIPAGAPAGVYEIRVTAYDANGETVQVQHPDGSATPLSTSASLTINSE